MEHKNVDCIKVSENTLSSHKRNESGTLTRVDILVECFKSEDGSYHDIADQLTECAIDLLIKARGMREEHKD